MTLWQKILDFIKALLSAVGKGSEPAPTPPPPLTPPVNTPPPAIDPMAGYASIPFDRTRLKQFLKACRDAGVTYGFGDKDPTPKTALPIDFNRVDCSGFTRVAVYYASNGAVMLPDGSFIENDWLKTAHYNGKPYKVSTYGDTGNKDNRVRICFIEPKGKEPGHVWLTLNGETYESHGNAGPDSRAWNNSSLRNCSRVYVLSDAEKVGA